MEMSLQNMIDALTMYYEESGYTDFYEKEIKCRKPEEIYELYTETFSDEMGIFWLDIRSHYKTYCRKLNI